MPLQRSGRPGSERPYQRPTRSGAEEPRIVANAIGELRRSTVASTFGPGAIVDFRTKPGAPISAVITGLDEWVRTWPDRVDMVHDPRLEQLLDVDGFRLAPVVKDRDRDAARLLPAVRFPRWLQCPNCHRVADTREWSTEDGNAARWCAACTRGRGPRGRVYVVPVRFIRACEAGHLDDFPWDRWVEHASDCTGRRDLKLISTGAGLAGVRVLCTSCNRTRSMESAFDRDVMKGWSCSGWRPWLAGSREQACQHTPRTMQRGASNLYFPVVQSSLLIPPWNDDVEERLGDYWPDVLEAEPDERAAVVRRLLERGRVDIPPGWDRERFIARAVHRAADREARIGIDLRGEEWERFVHTEPDPETLSRDFELRHERPTTDVAALVEQVARVVRLRELRALRGFTRINPPPSAEDTGAATVAPLSLRKYRWLPAVEVRGEGIFLALRADAVGRWEQQPAVRERVRRLAEGYEAEFAERYGPDYHPAPKISPRLVLIHTFAHALMRQLALECGYSTASLRERLYASDSACGLLIYTATTDADGTLGGLQRQGESPRLGHLLMAAIGAQRWCSLDPLCIHGSMMASNDTNGACCHACVLAPETSCEEFNRFLDRALLVGTPADPALGFFRPWLECA